MYTNSDLNRAVKEGIFTDASVNKFRQYIEEDKITHSVDEENFRLISSFNDIFVVIASLLLLISSGWIALAVGDSFSAAVVALLAWGLSEYFVRKRKMSFPAIVLLIAFVSSVFRAFIDIESLFRGGNSEAMFVLASVVTVLATYIHWRRFRVPMTVAVGMAAVTVLIVSLFLSISKELDRYLEIILFIMGVIVFIVAMYWDGRDKQRITNDTDIAFWLHLLASPLIIHSIFLGLNIFDNQIGLFSIISIVISYVFLSMVSVVIDRRALMVSSLLYVLYALNRLFTEYGFEGYGLAMGGVIIGLGLLFLTAFWIKTRERLVSIMPEIIQNRVPRA